MIFEVDVLEIVGSSYLGIFGMLIIYLLLSLLLIVKIVALNEGSVRELIYDDAYA